jgi:hypothetical protein
MERKHAAILMPGAVIDELGLQLVLDVLQLVLDEQMSWDGGVMLTLLDLSTGEERYSFFAPFDEVWVVQ